MTSIENIKLISKKEQKVNDLKQKLEVEKAELESMKNGNIEIKNKYIVIIKYTETELYNILANAGAGKFEIKKSKFS